MAGSNPHPLQAARTAPDYCTGSMRVCQGARLYTSLCVCIVGGGSIATAAAGWLTREGKNLCVHVLTRQPEKWNKNLLVKANPTCRWGSMEPFRASIHLITSDAHEAVAGADLVLIAAPSHAHRELLEKVAPHLKEGAILGTLFGQGGFDWAVRSVLGEKASRLSAFFGLQHVPWLARSEVYGQEVLIIGPKKFLCAAVSPPSARQHVQQLLQLCFDQPCKCLSNFLCLTLTPSNQIIHPARYYSIFKDWDGRRVYKAEEISWGLYTEYDEEAAELLAAMDSELQCIKQALIKKFPALDLSSVKPIKERIIEQYGDDVLDKSSLHSVVSSNQGYAACRTPSVKVDGGFQPDIKGRLFWEDMPAGLCVLKGIAEMLQIPTPTIDKMIVWHQQFMGVEFVKDGRLNPETIKLTSAPARWGVTTLEQLVAPSLAL